VLLTTELVDNFEDIVEAVDRKLSSDIVGVDR
jgi:hypothetical protein